MHKSAFARKSRLRGSILAQRWRKRFRSPMCRHWRKRAFSTTGNILFGDVGTAGGARCEPHWVRHMKTARLAPGCFMPSLRTRFRRGSSAERSGTRCHWSIPNRHCRQWCRRICAGCTPIARPPPRGRSRPSRCSARTRRYHVHLLVHGGAVVRVAGAASRFLIRPPASAGPAAFGNQHV